MSLPPGFLDELRTRISLSDVVGRKVMWDSRKSNQAKGDMWAPCPFHQEKTASFHVDDRKGFYYCFGCHAKGDAISFVRETENVGFMEAVEIIAREAGMPVPKRDPAAQAKADKRTQLAEVMEQGVQYYRLQLKTAAAGAARDYLAGRGLSEAAQDRWEIGFAPDTRQGVFAHLTGKGVAADLVIDAGLAARPDDGREPYDRFRGRIIFPIRDARGRAIALGGRAMDPNARAKYLNSPETELFDKGRSLYNHGPAREAAGKGAPLIVAEGYMDVIALVEAGFTACVAPLGTAITESQLQMMWRVSPEPVIALDGDRAGLQAALRLIDLALPLLEAGQSLRFALMPEGMDPDDVLKKQGKNAMQRLLEGALPMVQLLWRREVEGGVFDSPERKAALDKKLRAAIAKIKDPSIRGHYGEAIKQMRWELFAPKRSAKKGPWKGKPAPVQPSTKSSLLVSAGQGAEEHLREAVILATLVLNPEVLPDFEGELERLDFTSPEHRHLRDCLLRFSGAADLRDRIETEAGAALASVLAPRHVQISPAVRAPGDAEVAAMCVAEELAKLAAKRGVLREIEEAMEDIGGVVDEGLTWRLKQAAEARDKAVRSENEDKAMFDTAPSGAQMDREERDAFARLLGEIEQNSGAKAKK
ncbi:DNA primase [Profundibacter sp.]|uniref:DNA primase n=1 Tax=Profundibacter sp. TaxID=3101071 RepID=UPI003D0FC25D